MWLKFSYRILCVIVFMFFSCKKETIQNDRATKSLNSISPTTLPLNYTINESGSVQASAATIHYTAIFPQYTLQFNVNRDTTIDYFIDLNADQINDFKFTLERKQYLWCGNPPSYAYGTIINLSSLDSNSHITNAAMSIPDPVNGYLPFSELLDSGLVISNNIYQFNKQNVVLHDNAMAIGTFISFNGDKYIPLLFKNNHYGWIHLQGFGIYSGTIIIKGFAYNETKNNPIKTGQKNNY